MNEKVTEEVLKTINRVLTNLEENMIEEKLTKEFISKIIKTLKYDEKIKSIILKNNIKEESFFYNLSNVINNTTKINTPSLQEEVNCYKEKAKNKDEYLYLLFISKDLEKNKVFWFNLIKMEKLKENLQNITSYIDEEIKKDSIYKKILATTSLKLGEKISLIPALYDESIMKEPFFAIEYIKNIYYELEYKEEVINSLLGIKNKNEMYEYLYGKHIRNNIEKLYLDKNFINKFIDIDNIFINLIPPNLIEIETINHVIEKILNEDCYKEEDLRNIEELEKLRNKKIRKLLEKKRKTI